MITLNEVRTVLQKMAALGSHILQMHQLMHEVVQLAGVLKDMNDDLTLEQDRMTAKIRSVEVLEEVLRTRVYGVQPEESYRL